MYDHEKYREKFETLESIRTPGVIRVLGWMTVGLIVAVGLFFAFVPWVQTTAGNGVVTALDPDDRLQNINALVSGRIERWYVRDGSIVEAGDPIVRIADNDPQLLERLQAERAQIMARLESTRANVRTAEIDLERSLELFNQGLAARREYEQAQIRVEELRAVEAEAAAALNRADVNLSRLSVQTVRAPRNGVILNVNAGDTATYVTAGEVLATFVPAGSERIVEVFIDGRDVALVEAGARARIQFEGWPAVQFSGWPSVAIGTFPGRVYAVDPSAQTNGLFRVLIVEDEDAPEEEQWPDERFVRFGSAARAWVLLETVRVGFEVWRQLNSFPPSFPRSESPGAGGPGGDGAMSRRPTGEAFAR